MDEIIVAVVLALAVVLIYAGCVVAGRADDASEESFRKFKEKQGKNQNKEDR